MSWENILKNDESKINAILDVAEKFNGKKERLRLDDAIDDYGTNIVIDDLLQSIKTAMHFNEGKEYQELKEMQRTLEKLKREKRDDTPKVYDSPSWNRIRYGSTKKSEVEKFLWFSNKNFADSAAQSAYRNSLKDVMDEKEYLKALKQLYKQGNKKPLTYQQINDLAEKYKRGGSSSSRRNKVSGGGVMGGNDYSSTKNPFTRRD